MVIIVRNNTSAIAGLLSNKGAFQIVAFQINVRSP